jgi:hypothetical protein
MCAIFGRSFKRVFRIQGCFVQISFLKSRAVPTDIACTCILRDLFFIMPASALGTASLGRRLARQQRPVLARHGKPSGPIPKGKQLIGKIFGMRWFIAFSVPIRCFKARVPGG